MENRYKVCVYAICKNEAQFVDRWMDSMKEADIVVVTDTGSTDDTVDKLRARGALVFEEEIKPWRFDVARNISLNHVPENMDICICTDLDEVLNTGWRQCLEQAWTDSATNGKYLYNWSLKPDGTPDIQFTYFKVHSRKDYKWVCPVHECISYIGSGVPQVVFIEGMVLNHYPDPAKSRGSYLPLLELAVREGPENDRMAYYLGREYMYHGRWQQCIDTLTRYLKLKTATWKEERSSAMRWVAKSFCGLGQYKEAVRWYFKAIAEAPHMREPYVELARAAYEQADWPMVFCMTDQALLIKQKSLNYISMGYAWDYTPYDLASLSCYYLGMYNKALEYAREAVCLAPDDLRLSNNLSLIENKLRANK